EEADFFSFGTNDLTQMTFGFSRDDVEGRMMSTYIEQGLLKRNPFETIDPGGVGELVKVGAQRGRRARADLKLGVCGEHGGDPEANRYRGELFVAPIDGCDAPRALVAGDQRVARPRWSPDGTRLAFVARPEDEGAELRVVTVGAGEVRTVATWSDDIDELAWS